MDPRLHLGRAVCRRGRQSDPRQHRQIQQIVKNYRVNLDFNDAEAIAHAKALDGMFNTLFKDVNIYSISPVFVFDVARIGPRSGSIGGTRYGPGGGVRLELATTAHFTLGYAVNVNRGPGEGRGNLFFAIGIRDLFY